MKRPTPRPPAPAVATAPGALALATPSQHVARAILVLLFKGAVVAAVAALVALGLLVVAMTVRWAWDNPRTALLCFAGAGGIVTLLAAAVAPTFPAALGFGALAGGVYLVVAAGQDS